MKLIIRITCCVLNVVILAACQSTSLKNYNELRDAPQLVPVEAHELYPAVDKLSFSKAIIEAHYPGRKFEVNVSEAFLGQVLSAIPKQSDVKLIQLTQFAAECGWTRPILPTYACRGVYKVEVTAGDNSLTIITGETKNNFGLIANDSWMQNAKSFPEYLGRDFSRRASRKLRDLPVRSAGVSVGEPLQGGGRLNGPTSKFPTSPVAVTFKKVRSRPDDIAVIIGNADYQKGKDIPNVTPAYADAAGIRRYVRQALGVRKENIIFLKDATQANMISTFGSGTNPKGQLFNYVTPGKSRVFVYYSGHGAPGGKDGDSYIVPSNAQASTIELNGYLLKTLYKNLSKIPAKSITVVLEACFSGASQAGTVIAKASPIYLKAKETGVPPNITLIAAGAANQIASWEQDSSSGLFTEYFLKGMSGKADAKPYGNGDGKVDYAELGRYLKGTMTYFARRYYGREQTAQIVVGK